MKLESHNFGDNIVYVIQRADGKYLSTFKLRHYGNKRHATLNGLPKPRFTPHIIKAARGDKGTMTQIKKELEYLF